MILRVVCTNNNRATDHLEVGRCYYVATTAHPTWMNGKRTPGYRMIAPKVVEDFKDGSCNSSDHVRSAARFEVVSSELCEKYNHVTVLCDLKDIFKQRGEEI